MGLITPDLSGIVDGQVGDAADWTTPFNTIINEFNGNIDNDNIKAAANIAFSKLASDAWSTWAPALQGCSGTPTVNVARYQQIGKIVKGYLSVTGTSNATTKSITLPVSPKSNQRGPLARCTDATTAITAGYVDVVASTFSANVYKDVSSNAWTNSGTCLIEWEFEYEAA